MVDIIRRGEAPTLVAPAHFLVVEAPYYDEIGAMLRAGAEAALKAAGATFEIVRVPGALEIPTAMRLCCVAAEQRGRAFGGAIGLGCVIRGETYHFEIVATESARGILQLGIDAELPVGNGILTVETEAQAVKRADPQAGDKGGEAARAAMILWRIKQDAEAPR